MHRETSAFRSTGQCACGVITYCVAGALRNIINCHCDRCRRTSGHHVAASQCAVADLSVSGDGLRWWSPVEGVSYGFCSTCGSSLFWRTDGDRDHISIMAGALDGPTGLRTVAAWFVDEAGDYHLRQAGVEEHVGNGRG